MIEHEMRKIPNTFGLDVEAAVFLEYSSVEEWELYKYEDTSI